MCGVEVAVSVMSQHVKTVPCKVRRLIRDAHANGLVRCEDAVFIHLSMMDVRAGKIKTGIITHPGKPATYSAVEEAWADVVAVALMRKTGQPLEMRIDAVRRYAEWRKENPMEIVYTSTEDAVRNDGWRNCKETDVSFNRKGSVVRYDGGGAL